jgi:hypothetical protein
MVRINSKGVAKGCSNTKGARLDIKNSFPNNKGNKLLRVESIGYNVKGHRKIHKNFASIRVKNIIYIYFAN